MLMKLMMNRLYSMLLASLTLLAGAGCSRVETPRMLDSDHCIEITIGNIHPSLKAKASERGDDAYNENLVQSVDCFFYANGQTDSPAVFTALGRGAEAKAEGDSTVYVVKVFFNDADAQKMFGSKTSGTCQFFVVCNAPLSYGADTSVPALKELVVENDFTAQLVQGSFVMSADEPGTVTLTTDGDVRSASGRVKVSRAAAKIQFYLDIPKVFTDETGQFWEPVLSAGVQISMTNSVKRGKVDGDYSVQPSDYVSYGARIVDSLDTGNRISGYETYKFTHVPFYSYPCAWSDLSDYACQVVFRIAWRIVGESNYMWKKYQLSPNISTLDLKRNHYYRTFVRVQSLGGADKEHEVIIPEADYVILKWIDEGATAGEGQVPGQLTTYKYLVVDEPDQELNNEETAYFTYVTSAPLTSIKISKIEYYDNTQAVPLRTQTLNRTVEDDSGTVSTNAGDLIISKGTPGLVTIYHSVSNMYSQIKVYATITNGDACTQDIVLVQNPSIQLIRQGSAGNVFVNGWFARLTTTPPGSDWDDSYTSWGNRYYYYRYNDNTTGASGTFYHNGYDLLWSGSQISSGTETIDGHRCGSYGTILGTVSGLDTSIDRNFYTTLVMVSSFNDSNDYYVANGEDIHYRIGDPRVPSVTHYSGANSWTNENQFYAYVYHNNSPTELAASWSDPENILIQSQSADDRNIIAPKLLVSSALNANTGLTFEQAVKRGATYQEAGYPAGRWRLPSEAEIAFIVARQRDGVIPTLYATNSYYWSGSGRLVYIPTDKNAGIQFSDPAAGVTRSCRFVYDLWYWGDDPAATNVYHPNGHNTDY